MKNLYQAAGLLLMLIGLMLTVASFIAVGTAQRWDQADEFAEDSRRPVRKAGMMLSALGITALIATTPLLVARLYGNPGFGIAAGSWFVCAVAGGLFLMALGLTNIAMPALGEVAAAGGPPAQPVADAFVRQPAIMLAFIGGNLFFLSWLGLGAGVAQSGVFPPWLGWLVAGAGLVAWLGFLHVPGVHKYLGWVWPAGILLLGVYLFRNAAQGTP